MELIVISSPVAVADEPILINNLFMAGLKYFHIRKPESDIIRIRKLIEDISPLFYNRISLHQFHDIGVDYGIKRLHYTEKARNVSGTEKWQNYLDEGFMLSTSAHDLSILPDLGHFNYVFYGPVFNSISKPGHQGKLTGDFKLDKTNTKARVIALGGVEVSNLRHIKRMGFDGAAVLGTLWNQPGKAISCFNELQKNLPD